MATTGVIILLSCLFFYLSYRKITQQRSLKNTRNRTPSSHYGWLVAIWCALPSFIIFSLLSLFHYPLIEWIVLESFALETDSEPAVQATSFLISTIEQAIATQNYSLLDNPALIKAAKHYHYLDYHFTFATSLFIIAIATILGLIKLKQINLQSQTRIALERVWLIILIIAASAAVLTTIAIILTLIGECFRFFSLYSAFDFLFGLQWSPQIAIRQDQVGSSGAFGAVPVFAGTAMVATIALFMAVPVGLMSAIYLSQFATPQIRNWVKPTLEILAGIPTVVYGFIAALQFGPMVRDFAVAFDIPASTESALAAGLVMGVMLIPFISSLSEDVISAVPLALRDGSLALGATHSETILKVLIPAALPGIVGALMLALSRAIGETMIVVMAAGLAANLTANPFEAVTTVTVQIVTLLVGDHEFDSVKTLSAFALGMTLFIITLGLNIFALRIVRKYREIYE